MLNQFIIMFQTMWHQYGIACVGTFMTTLAFGLSYHKNAQYSRFYLIGRGFLLLFLTKLALILNPCLATLNSYTYLPERYLQIFVGVLSTLAIGFFVASVFIHLTKRSVLFLLPFIISIICGGIEYGLLYLLPELNWIELLDLLIGIALLTAAGGLRTISSAAQKMVFKAPSLALIALGLYFILTFFQLMPLTRTIPFILYSFVSVLILMAQLRFMTLMAEKYHTAFENEKQHKTFFWDIAPFPILLTKLLDDSVVYMNAACQKVLGLSDEQKKNLHFSDYFVQPSRREELISVTKEQDVVDNFEVELNIQSEEHNTAWITLSARVFEIDSELVLYINFTNITKQKETEQELFIQASTDTLTGLYNRRQFIALTDQALALSQREGTAYTVLMLDIDHFKSINDAYGHDVGDLVLQNLANTIKDTLRKSDIIARWGGEEFIIFLYNTPPEKAVTPANKLREAVQQSVVPIQDNSICYTISIGVSQSQTPDITTLQKEADIALYASKEQGRNRVTMYQDDLNNSTGASS